MYSAAINRYKYLKKKGKALHPAMHLPQQSAISQHRQRKANEFRDQPATHFFTAPEITPSPGLPNCDGTNVCAQWPPLLSPVNLHLPRRLNNRRSRIERSHARLLQHLTCPQLRRRLTQIFSSQAPVSLLVLPMLSSTASAQ